MFGVPPSGGKLTFKWVPPEGVTPNCLDSTLMRVWRLRRCFGHRVYALFTQSLKRLGVLWHRGITPDFFPIRIIRFQTHRRDYVSFTDKKMVLVWQQKTVPAAERPPCFFIIRKPFVPEHIQIGLVPKLVWVWISHHQITSSSQYLVRFVAAVRRPLSLCSPVKQWSHFEFRVQPFGYIGKLKLEL